MGHPHAGMSSQVIFPARQNSCNGTGGQKRVRPELRVAPYPAALCSGEREVLWAPPYRSRGVGIIAQEPVGLRGSCVLLFPQGFLSADGFFSPSRVFVLLLNLVHLLQGLTMSPWCGPLALPRGASAHRMYGHDRRSCPPQSHGAGGTTIRPLWYYRLLYGSLNHLLVL
jgi:hypothetical protein